MNQIYSVRNLNGDFSAVMDYDLTNLVSSNSASWGQGGGGGGSSPYTRTTAGFTEYYEEDGHSWQDLKINNNSYTTVDWTDYDDAYNVKIKLPNVDFPMAIVIFSGVSAGVPIENIQVFNGDTEIQRVYPAQILKGYHEVDCNEPDTYYGPLASYNINGFMLSDYLEFNILGDTYTLYNKIGETYHPGSV